MMVFGGRALGVLKGKLRHIKNLKHLFEQAAIHELGSTRPQEVQGSTERSRGNFCKVFIEARQRKYLIDSSGKSLVRG